jgi:hypothetical protein
LQISEDNRELSKVKEKVYKHRLNAVRKTMVDVTSDLQKRLDETTASMTNNFESMKRDVEEEAQADLAESLGDLVATNDALLSEVEDLKRNLQIAVKEQESEMRRVVEEVRASSEGEINRAIEMAAEESRKVIEEERESCEATIRSMRVDFEARFSEEIQKKEKEIRQLKQHLDSQHNDIDGLHTRLRQSEDNCKKLEKEVQKAREDADARESTLQSLHSEAVRASVASALKNAQREYKEELAIQEATIRNELKNAYAHDQAKTVSATTCKRMIR